MNQIEFRIQKRNPKPNPVRYEIKTLDDIYKVAASLPEKKRNRFLNDFKMGIKSAIAINGLAEYVAKEKGIEFKKEDVVMPEFTWIDD